jgi:hypothetical protein
MFVRNKLFYIIEKLIYYLANFNIQHIKITRFFPDIGHIYYNLISLNFADYFNQNISSLAGSFLNLKNLHLD